MSEFDPAYTAFRSSLSCAVGEVILWWARNHAGERLQPETLTGLCGRRFPVNAKGQTCIGLDERLWQLGRNRYVARG